MTDCQKISTVEDFKNLLRKAGFRLYEDIGENKMDNDFKEREIGALWAKEGKKGTFYTGNVDGKKVVMFATGNSGNRPCFKIFVEREREY